MSDISHDPADFDVLSLAQSMIRHDTSHDGEGADTLPLARMLRSVWEHADVPTETIATPKPGNVHFLARIRGTGIAPPLLVLAHSDVVPVQRERWRTEPFGAAVHDGFLYGRGSLDMKGAGAAFMNALLRHVTEGAVFDRDIIYLADCDEEGGWYGTPWLVENHWDKVAAGAVVTEGGWTLAQSDGRTPMLASMSCLDRAFGAVRLTTEHVATHSSRPQPGGAITRLAQVVERVGRWQPAVTLTDLNRRYFAALASSTTDDRLAEAIAAVLDADTPRSAAAAADAVVKHSPYPWLHNAMLRATVAFVAQDGGRRANVIPARASVLLQIRFLPGGQTPRELLGELRTVVDDDATTAPVGPPYETPEQTLARWERDWSQAPSPTGTDIFAAWQDAARRTFPGVPAVPAMFEAGTSGKPWRDRGVPVYGLYPYLVDHETMVRMHGDDERVHVDELRRGAELLYRMFARFTVPPGTDPSPALPAAR
ncbi:MULTISPECIES: M20/M25/M40 family metallo-hydrolase [Micromonospora]|uniref:M20/M25/M40 family metallo-hydrolase n=1 Tax=Micromonospora TaxID=1873 RepID=UPI0033DC8A3A